MVKKRMLYYRAAGSSQSKQVVRTVDERNCRRNFTLVNFSKGTFFTGEYCPTKETAFSETGRDIVHQWIMSGR